ncbi:MAG: hypothetical protein SF051_02255, partial [Elusimicrobiota bacterium]|nr:hypothetical protein [Elusimicrobiota bacterium]
MSAEHDELTELTRSLRRRVALSDPSEWRASAPKAAASSARATAAATKPAPPAASARAPAQAAAAA